jgi:hypothetical protein
MPSRRFLPRPSLAALLALGWAGVTGAAPAILPVSARMYASASIASDGPSQGAGAATSTAMHARAAAAEPCRVISGPPAEEAAPLVAAATPSAGGATTPAATVDAEIDRALREPTAAGLHTGTRYDLSPAVPPAADDLPLLVRLYLRIPGSQVRACGPAHAAAQAMHYYPVAPVWRSPSGLCHFSLQADENRGLLARPAHDIEDDEAWRYQLFAARAERCESVELESYAETAGVSDRDLATFFRMWQAFVTSPVRFETALRRFEHAAPAGLWRPPAEIDVLSRSREHLRIVSIVNERESDGLLDRLSDGVAGPRLGVRLARVGGGDPWFDLRLGWGTMSLLGFRARED